MRRWHILLLIPLVWLISTLGCGSIDDPWAGKGGPPRIVSSFPPTTSFIKRLAGDRAAVITLCTTTGPHDYQYTIRDRVLLKKADLLVGNGLGMDDHYLDRLAEAGENRSMRFRKLGDAIRREDLRQNPDHEPGKNHKNHGDGCACCQGEHDPHAWLGIPQAIAMVQRLRDDLKAIDPAGAATYDENSASFVKELQDLQSDGKNKLAKLAVPIITYHDSMGYFAQSFRVTPLGSLQQVNPGATPDPKKLAKLVEACKGKERVLIALEPQYPASSADTLRKALTSKHPNLEVTVLTLDPLETCGSEADLTGEWYLRKMRENIDTLANQIR